ncbi:nucleoside-diphosphate kinase [bacterium]|nr:nucleoside-diphosphate kinase [bacterium]
MTERTLVFVKPDGVQRNLTGEIIGRFERSGMKIIALKMMTMSREFAEKHYEAHRGKPFYSELIKHITSGPIIAMVLEGENAIKQVRGIMGATSPADAEPGTIRGDLGIATELNLVHGSDSAEAAQAEIAHFFTEDELAE